MSHEEDLIDYSDEEIGGNETAAASNGKKGDPAAGNNVDKKGSYVGIHSTGFRDFLLKPELIRAIGDCGFEHPSEVQQTCIPQALLGGDIICQAKSGLGKTAVFVLATLQQIEPVNGEASVVVMCHTRELAYQIRDEYNRFSKYMPDIKTGVFYGGTPINKDIETIKNKDTCPHIIVGTPGRLKALMLEQPDMRTDVQDVFRATPQQKQVMMFSATLSDSIKPICRKFMQNPTEHYVDEDTKLTLHGLQQYYIKLEENEKNRKLNDLLDELQFNQVIIFVKSTRRANELDKLLRECNFPSIAVHSGVSQEERIRRYKEFKEFKKRICVATDVFGRGIDIERINLAINYDLTTEADSYLHRVGRAGRFGTKGLAISFVSSEEDANVLKEIEKRFEVALPEFPKEGVDASTYMAS
ncbi:hypothetical protein V2G26_016827 [Clonostachys chloroleuca]